jgi:hypothetical protein
MSFTISTQKKIINLEFDIELTDLSGLKHKYPYRTAFIPPPVAIDNNRSIYFNFYPNGTCGSSGASASKQISDTNYVALFINYVDKRNIKFKCVHDIQIGSKKKIMSLRGNNASRGWCNFVTSQYIEQHPKLHFKISTDIDASNNKDARELRFSQQLNALYENYLKTGDIRLKILPQSQSLSYADPPPIKKCKYKKKNRNPVFLFLATVFHYML